MTVTLGDMMREAKRRVKQVSPEEAQRSGYAQALVVDVREPAEWSKTHLPGAVNIPRGLLELKADPASPAADPALCERKAGPVVVYCFGGPGVRSMLAADTLVRMGYRNVLALRGGLQQWIEDGFAVEATTERGER